MDPQLRAATLGAPSIQAPASPLGASNAPELAQLYGSSFQLPLASAGAQAAGNIAAQQVKEAEQAKQHKDLLGNIQNYKIVQKQDGGYDFFDPDGQQVDIATLAQRTGVKPQDVLKDSQNPIDIQFRNDYSNLQDYINAVLSKDTKKVDAYQQADQQLKQYTDKGGVDRLIKEFQLAYQRYYVPRTQNPQAWGYNVPQNPIVPTAQSSAFGLDSSSGASL